MNMLEDDEEKPRMKSCLNCRHYNAYIYQLDIQGEDDHLTADYGECRRFPPKLVSPDERGFPIVDDNMWCGEFDF